MPDALQTMSTKEPYLEDFYDDMNEHANADYKRVGESFVLELESYPVGWVLTVWRAVKGADRYITPDDGNNYHWDAIGRKSFENYDSGRETFDAITGRKDVGEFTDENPYEGPRTPYHERD